MKIRTVTLWLWILMVGFPGRLPAGEAEIEASAAPAVKVGHGVVTMPLPMRQRLGLETFPIQPATAPPEVFAFGSVLDPFPLVLLDTELRDAEAAVALSDTQVRRARELFGTEQTVSRRALEQAENQLRLDTTRRELAARRLQLEWDFAGRLTAAARTQLVEQLLQRTTVLVRVEVPVGETIPPAITTARVRAAGRESWTDAVVLGLAVSVDPRSQGQAFLLQISPASAELRAGLAVEARLVKPGPLKPGWSVPRAAVVRYLGRSWIYLQTGEGTFERREVALLPAAGDAWFTTTPLPEAGRGVSVGAAMLLSAELQAAAGAGEGD